MVNILQGITIANGGDTRVPYLKVGGISLSFSLKNNEICLLGVGDFSGNLPIGKWESILSRIRGYYSSEDKFNELKEWYDNAISTREISFTEFDEVNVDESGLMPTIALQEVEQGRCEPDREPVGQTACERERPINRCGLSGTSRIRRVRNSRLYARDEPPIHDGNPVSAEDVNNALEFAREVERDRMVDECL